MRIHEPDFDSTTFVAFRTLYLAHGSAAVLNALTTRDKRPIGPRVPCADPDADGCFFQMYQLAQWSEAFDHLMTGYLQALTARR